MPKYPRNKNDTWAFLAAPERPHHTALLKVLQGNWKSSKEMATWNQKLRIIHTKSSPFKLSLPTSCSSKAESKTALETNPSFCSLKTRSLFIFKWKSVKLIMGICNGLILYSLENIVMAINSSDGACMCEHECLVTSHNLQAGPRLLSLG